MQQKLAIILVLLLVVVAVVVAVLMMGNNGGGKVITTGPSGITISNGESESHNAVICDISGSSTVQGQEISFSGAIKAKKPNKFDGNITMVGPGYVFSFTIISDGINSYMFSPMLGEKWIGGNVSGSSGEITDEDFNLPPEQIAAKLSNSMSGMPEGVTLPSVSCRYVSDMPDSEFQLPLGAEVATQEEIAALFGITREPPSGNMSQIG
jgi:hypothetical protein